MSATLESIEANHRAASFLRKAAKALTNNNRNEAIEILELSYRHEMRASDMAGTNPVTEYDKQQFLVEAKEIRQEIEMLRSAEV